MNVPEVISLIRFSTAEQVAEGKAGIEGQRNVNLNSARFHGVRIRREMVVVDVSGQDVRFDPQFQQLFEELKDPTLAGVLVPEQSRLIRPEGFDDYPILGHFQRNGKVIYTPTGKIDPTTPEGRITLTTGCMMSGEELHTIRNRFARGKADDRLKRKHPGGNQMLPRTVRFVRDRQVNANGKVVTTGCRWELVPLEAERMKRAFPLLFEGDSYALIAEKIGGGWTGNGVRQCLMNPIHIGVRRYEWEAKGEKYPVKAKPETYAKHEPGWEPKRRRKLVKRAVPLDVPTREELEAGTAKPIVEPIISIADFDRAQRIIQERMTKWRKSKIKNENRERFLALQISECSCGQPLYPRYGSRGPHLDAAYCRSRVKGHGPACGGRSISRVDLDAAIEQTVSQMVNADFLLGALKVALEMQQSAPDPARQERERMLTKLAKGRANLLDALAGGDITRDEFRSKMATLEQEVRALEAQIPPTPPEADPKQIVALIARAFCQFGFNTTAEKQAILRGAVKRIVIDSHAREITGVTISGGYLGTGANSVLRSRVQFQICAAPDVAIRFPQPIKILTLTQDEWYARREAKKAATVARLGTEEYKEAHLAARRAREGKAGAKAEVYAKKRATLAKWKRDQRAQLRETDPEAYAALKAKAAADQRARRARLRVA